MNKLIKFFLCVSVLIFIGGFLNKLGVFKFVSGGKMEKLSAVQKEKYQYAGPWDVKMFEGFYTALEKQFANDPNYNSLAKVKGGIVPHHLIAGHLPAAFFNSLKKQNPSVVVILGPNHFSRGKTNILTAALNWQTPFGITKTNSFIVKSLAQKGLVKIDEETIKEEHSVYSLIPFIKKSLPDASVVPIIIKNKTSKEELNKLIEELKSTLPQDAVIVASIDFSHYQTLPVSNFHDELSMTIIKSFDFDRIDELEIDSTPSLYAVMKLMELFGTQKTAFEIHTNSAELGGDLSTVETTSHYAPFFVSGAPSEEQVVSILSFGDIMIDRNVKNRIDKNGFEHILDTLAGREGRFFQGMDTIIANLEGPFANFRRETSKTIAFSFDQKLIPQLKKYGFKLFSLANNHSYDMGLEGFRESKAALKKFEIEFFGKQVGADKDSLLYKTIGKQKIAFIGVNDIAPQMDIAVMEKLIKEADTNADYTIIFPHWGDEYKPVSNKRQQELAHKMIDAGADAVIGSHPHVVQEMEIYKNKPIFYSLGNFIFDQYFSVPTQEGLGVGIVFYDKSHSSIYLFPLESTQSKVKLMARGKALKNLQEIIDRSRLAGYDFNNFNLILK